MVAVAGGSPGDTMFHPGGKGTHAWTVWRGAGPARDAFTIDRDTRRPV